MKESHSGNGNDNKRMRHSWNLHSCSWRQMFLVGCFGDCAMMVEVVLDMIAIALQ